MAIRNTNNTILPIKYCSEYCITIEDTQAWDANAASLIATHPLTPYASALPSNRRELKIPFFQRGIEWDFDLLQRCIESKSKTLGITVIGAHNGAPNYEFILDGLQRYSAFLSLFFHLRDILFSPIQAGVVNPFNVHQSVASSASFHKIRTSMSLSQGLVPVITYNYNALLSHSRMLIQNSFKDWNDQQLVPNLSRLTNHTNAAFKLADSQKFFDALSEFVDKPIFSQEITGFVNISELIYTFNGLNTVRMELSTADICRSILIDGLSSCNSPQATAQQILKTEQTFNSSFLTPTGRIKRGYQPFISALDQNWQPNNSSTKLIPSIFNGSHNAANIVSDFDSLKLWIDDFELFADSNNYLSFIKDIGENSYIATLFHFFHRYTTPTLIPDSELHQIAVAYFRLYIKGSVGGSLPITCKCANNEYSTLADFIVAVNPFSTGVNVGISGQAIDACLSTINSTKRAQIVFNACQLPSIRSGATWGDPFHSMQFSQGGSNWSVDHMIADANFALTPPSTGDQFKDSLRNFVPILNADNSSYKRTACATKLDGTASYYSTYLNSAAKYVGGVPNNLMQKIWSAQSFNGGNQGLDNKDYLLLIDPANSTCYGEERITIIRDLLVDRI